MAMSLWFSSSAVSAIDEGDPLTSSPTTLSRADTSSSAMRTTLTAAPMAANPSDKAALNVAIPHGVGGCVLRMPKLGMYEKCCIPKGAINGWTNDGTFKTYPD